MTSKSEQIINDHRKMVMMTGMLSDFQLDNLKKWPFIIFNDLKEAVLEYNFENTSSPGSVTYILQFNIPTKVEDIKKQADDITLWVRFLFWKETEVKIIIKED